MIPLILGGMVLSLAACGQVTAPTRETVCAVGPADPLVAVTATSAENAPTVPASAQQALTDAALARDDACVGLLTPDGELHGYPLTPLGSDGGPELGEYRSEGARRNVQAFTAQVERSAATASGLDPVGLLRRAAELHPPPTDLWLVTSGLSDSRSVGLVGAGAGWRAEGRVLGQQLVTRGDLLPLAGWYVHLVGLGEPAHGQEPLSGAARLTLRTLWTEICRATGASCDAAALPVHRTPLSTNRVQEVVPPADPVLPALVRLPLTLFDENDWALRPEADGPLHVLVADLRDGDARVEIVGRTDAVTGTPDANQTLSERRARAVADRLVALGLPRQRLLVRGAGQSGADADAERRDPRRIDDDRRVDVHVLGGDR